MNLKNKEHFFLSCNGLKYASMIKALLFLCLLLISVTSFLFAQSTDAPLNKDYYHLINLYEIKGGKRLENFHSAFRPYDRQYIAQLVDTLITDSIAFSKQDQFNLQYLANDNWEWSEFSANESKNPLFNTFYRKKSDLFHVATEDFDLHVNPVLYFSAGREKDGDETAFINTRGLEVRGMVDKKVGFYTFLGENQIAVPAYVDQYIANNNVPGEGFWKTFKENGYDFFTARGHIDFQATKHIGLQLGHGKHFIGNGYRSMILSDFSNNYFYFKINTRVWRINYTNLFTELRADAFGNAGGLFGTGRFPKKWMALHHLSINISKNFNLGLFESIVFAGDYENGNPSFEARYLNPIIFYRAIEQDGGSTDNAILGADFKWNFARRFSLYGQLVLDEFLLDNFLSERGSWTNKYAGQLGLKYIDVLNINTLDLQVETNFSRPYTYSHETIFNNYAHYRQPLAHPLGANFREYIAIARFQPINRLHLTGKVIMADYGTDTTGTNVGQNIMLNYNTRASNTGNEIGQGINTDLLFMDFTASFMLKHNLFIDLKQVYRKLDSQLESRSRSDYFTSLSIRLNIAQREHMF